jgi:hypothetical protein
LATSVGLAEYQYRRTIEWVIEVDRTLPKKSIVKNYIFGCLATERLSERPIFVKLQQRVFVGSGHSTKIVANSKAVESRMDVRS